MPVAISQRAITVNQDLKALTPINTDAEFIYWYSKYKEFDIRHTCAKSGTTVESIEFSELEEYPIPICSVLEQARIVQEIESRLSVCDHLEQEIEKALQKSEALRQSILKKAFEGKLVPQDPAEEPAEVLLERIKAEKVK